MNALKRIDQLKKAVFTEGGFDGYLIFNNANLLYFLGFPGTSALLIPADGENTTYVYGVNYEQAKAEGRDFKVQLVKSDENLIAKIARQAKDCGIKKLSVDALSVESWRALTKEFPSRKAVEVCSNVVQALRMIKDPREIEFMRKAGELTSEGMKIAVEAVKPGAKEYEVAAEIEYAMRKRGAGPTAFESIVASGECSAFPHGGCSGREIREGDLVVIDIGATCNYYCSDMTRTFVAGKSSEKQKRIYGIVKAAQENAFKSIKAGVPIPDVDAAARKVIETAGYGDFFVHRLGHGVGLEVHEPPTLSQTNKDLLAAGNVVTDEPGIYIAGYGGVRIEDTVLVQKNGAEKLTRGSYSLGDK
ncbi:MAG TPA: Xaa-Pro peptidase family protein [Candidatus Bathyarchaeia archaeon]|nr:Xaa-Pro peptidase family protein [Candidatus Bathyarchaeia archaeon]